VQYNTFTLYFVTSSKESKSQIKKKATALLQPSLHFAFVMTMPHHRLPSDAALDNLMVQVQFSKN